MNTTRKYDETRLAEEIVSVLPAGVARACSDDRDAIRFAVRGEGMKLRSIVLNRTSLRKLASDPAREVKIEYQQRSEFRYPRLVRPMVTKSLPRAVRFGLTFASVL
jgi:hypothetical protein